MNTITENVSLSKEVDMENFWMPFTANKQFKATPRILKSAKGMYFTTIDDKKVLDASAGLWCVNAGHCRDEITEAVHKQMMELDYAPPFQMGHPIAFEAAKAIAAVMPASGSEAVDTALKIALAYHRARGEGQRTRLIGRERGYSGVGFGGISVGGIVANRKAYSGALIPGVDHISHTHNLAEMAYSKGQPAWGAHLADDLERLCALHDPSTIAAVIVEPVAGSTGVLVPPQGYLERLRQICTKHGILLIFDEVITGFGRLGKATASELLGVTPDIITMAKAMNNAAIPMSGIAASRHVHDAIVNAGPGTSIEFFHGYTYSSHPAAAAACLATQEIYRREKLFDRSLALAPKFEKEIHALRGEPFVKDIRNLGLMGAVELESRDGAPGARAYDVFLKCMEKGVLARFTGDIMAFSPPLIVSEGQIEEIFSTVKKALHETA
jgi:beta-alanine--pyruvate transaminase